MGLDAPTTDRAPVNEKLPSSSVGARGAQCGGRRLLRPADRPQTRAGWRCHLEYFPRRCRIWRHVCVRSAHAPASRQAGILLRPTLIRTSQRVRAQRVGTYILKPTQPASAPTCKRRLHGLTDGSPLGSEGAWASTACRSAPARLSRELQFNLVVSTNEER